MKPKKEGNKYDKIIKENLEALFLPFLEQLLEIRIVSAERLPGELQTTLEREPDFVCKILTKEGKKALQLQKLTVKTIESMPITYDIKTDFLFKKGKEEGLKEGLEKGLEAGEERKEHIFVERGWKKGMPPEEIAELADMPVERVKAIIRELERKE